MIGINLKKFISILLIASAFFHLCGFSLVFVITQKSHRQYIRNKIKTELIKHQILEFSKSDISKGNVQFSFISKDEIKVNNSMYDIVSVRETKDSLFITCINDNEEEKLIEKYIDNEKKSDSNNNKLIYKNLKPFTVFVLNETRKNPEFYSIRILKNENVHDFYKSIISDVLSPPPKA